MTRLVELPGRTSLVVDERGDPHGPVVLLLHGLADSSRAFEPLLGHLPSSLRAVAVTQRGHGDAGKPASGYALPDLAADLRALVDVLRVDGAVVVGHSLGSAVALRFAIDHPDRVRGLVLIGAAPRLRGTPAARAYWDRTLAALTDPVPRDFVRALVVDAFVKEVPPPVLEAMIDDAAKVPLLVWRGALDARWRGAGDYAAQLAEVRAPTLVIWGDRDPRYGRAEQDALVAGIRGARLEVVEGAGHMVHVEEPDRCARAIAGFVAGARALP